MGFQSKTYSLSDEVVEAIERLRKQYGSPNKAFRAILLQAERAKPSEFQVGTSPAEFFFLKNSEISPDKKENADKQNVKDLKIDYDG